MKQLYFLPLFFWFIAIGATSQSIYETNSGLILIDANSSSSSTVINIVNENVVALLNTETGAIFYSVESELNNSDKKQDLHISFTGQLDDFNPKRISEHPIHYDIPGKISMQGRDKEFILPAYIYLEGEAIKLTSKFDLDTEDFDSVYSDDPVAKMSGKLKINVDLTLSK